MKCSNQIQNSKSPFCSRCVHNFGKDIRYPGTGPKGAGVIVKIHKKRALDECTNWFGINLLSIHSTIFTKVIIKQISDAVDKEKGEGRISEEPSQNSSQAFGVF
ncbi:hypothetical protein CHS0354_026635 [Potamilus streckersoni]|uniref:Uncharacterized protein n=1 Tax=Potamilus streckersoni TaxID=2493646 RepID=A0AAE0W459_9BIVA|nr:hypothetical protein CHS0354_026635 [Potamilus streckersoni]